MHPLKALSLLSWLILFLLQLGLFWPHWGINVYLAILLCVPLLLPLRGLLKENRYTYKWIGFLTLIYFCVGISELVSNPLLRIYGVGTTLASLVLFMTSIYFARLLGLRASSLRKL